MMKTQILLVILALGAYSRLYIPSEVESFNTNKVFERIRATQVTTSCNSVKATLLGPQLVDTQPVFSGYLNVAENSKSGLAYIFYGSQKAKSLSELKNYPTIIWLNGGPGSSSQLGNFLELGPIFIDESGQKIYNPHSWNVAYNVMFVDQPIGTGYGFAASFAEIPKNQDQVGQQFLYAWLQFLTAPTGCLKSYQDLQGLTQSAWYLFGESYAGKYVPAIAQAVLQSNDQQGTVKIPLKGIGIGDGFTDPLSVMSEMPSFGYNFGLIDFQERKTDESMALGGVLNIRRNQWLPAQLSFDNTVEYIVDQSGGVNVYNIFVMGDYESLEKPVEQYLNSDSTKQLFGFDTSIPYEMGSQDVYIALSEDFMKSDCVARVEYVLTKIPVVIYNGQNDLIVPNPATSRWVYALNYKDSQKFRSTDFNPWRYKNQIVGYVKQAGNLIYRIVNQAGHLVPMDQPVAALDLVNQFIQKQQ